MTSQHKLIMPAKNWTAICTHVRFSNNILLFKFAGIQQTNRVYLCEWKFFISFAHVEIHKNIISKTRTPYSVCEYNVHIAVDYQTTTKRERKNQIFLLARISFLFYFIFIMFIEISMVHSTHSITVPEHFHNRWIDSLGFLWVQSTCYQLIWNVFTRSTNRERIFFLCSKYSIQIVVEKKDRFFLSRMNENMSNE